MSNQVTITLSRTEATLLHYLLKEGVYEATRQRLQLEDLMNALRLEVGFDELPDEVDDDGDPRGWEWSEFADLIED